MSAAGERVELARYQLRTGERVLYGQRINGAVAVVDVPASDHGRVYLIERHIHSQAELEGLAAEYAQHSQACAMPAILATLRSARDVADAIG